MRNYKCKGIRLTIITVCSIRAIVVCSNIKNGSEINERNGYEYTVPGNEDDVVKIIFL